MTLAERRTAATREAIVEQAWSLSRSAGLTGWSVRELAAELGIAAPTLYSYFDGKTAIYDAMFRGGYEEFAAEVEVWSHRAAGAAAAEALVSAAASFVEFCVADPTRYQLLFQRVVPDFTPSADAYAASLVAYAHMRAAMARFGITDDSDLDLWTALVTGLAAQQISNDPGGDRWTGLVPRAVAMFCAHIGIAHRGGTTP